ncbi:MAG: hypothetical protein IKU64_02675 [Bacteroides sp.]|nr:hypothetical protein [Bacteroides sp.]
MSNNELMKKASKRSQVLPFSKIFERELTELTTANALNVYNETVKDGWYILRKESDSVFIKTGKGEILEIRADGTKGYFFAVGYLKTMSMHYQGHLQAIERLLHLLYDRAYTSGAALPRLCIARLAVQSLKCCFGGSELFPDADNLGELHPKVVECPIRSICKFNGTGHRRAKQAGCNPICELGLPPRQVELAKFLVNTSDDFIKIAQKMGLTENYVRKKAAEIYAHLKVENKNGLRQLLQNKRLL